MASKHFQFSKTITSIYNITARKMFVLSMCCGCQQMRMCIEQMGNEASVTPHLHCNVFTLLLTFLSGNSVSSSLLKQLNVSFKKTAASRFLHTVIEHMHHHVLACDILIATTADIL